MKVELFRLEEGPFGVLGALRLDGCAFCVTLEPPNFDNIKNKSCIPEGSYIGRRIHSPTFGETYLVQDVPNRRDILFHAGNTIVDTKGCILLGQYWGKLTGARAVLNSGKTFAKFMCFLAERDSFELVIKKLD